MIYLIEYLLTRIVGGLLNLLPFSLVLRLARFVGVLIFQLSGRARRIALTNLRFVYGADKSEAEIHGIAKEAFVHLAEFGVEWLRMPQIARAPEKYLKINHVDRIHQALKKRKGAMLLVSHTGNWEIMALIGGLLIAKPIGAVIYSLARPLKNPYLYRYILRLRGMTGLKSIDKMGGVKETSARLKENGIVCLLIDQRVREGSVETDFFGRKSLTTSLPAIAARRFGTPIFFVFLHRTPDLHFVMDVEGPFPIEATKNPKQDIQTNTQRFNDRIEAEIRKNPSQWLWMHNRWRLEVGPKDQAGGGGR